MLKQFLCDVSLQFMDARKIDKLVITDRYGCKWAQSSKAQIPISRLTN